MISCSICLDKFPINEFKINKNCGHICLCKTCFKNMLDQFEVIDVDNNDNIINQINCPICRTYGHYIDIYTTDLSGVIEINNSIHEGEESSEDILNILLNYGESPNYNILITEDKFYRYFIDNINKDKSIDNNNLVVAYYGTEFSYEYGKPYFKNNKIYRFY